MEDREIVGLIEITLNEKMEKNSDFIKYSFFELKVKYNLSEEEINKFLHYIKLKLENENYRVYFIGEKYEYKNELMQVENNEFVIAIRN